MGRWIYAIYAVVLLFVAIIGTPGLKSLRKWSETGEFKVAAKSFWTEFLESLIDIVSIVGSVRRKVLTHWKKVLFVMGIVAGTVTVILVVILLVNTIRLDSKEKIDTVITAGQGVTGSGNAVNGKSGGQTTTVKSTLADVNFWGGIGLLIAGLVIVSVLAYVAAKSWKNWATWGKYVPWEIFLALIAANLLAWRLLPHQWEPWWEQQRLFWPMNLGVLVAAGFFKKKYPAIGWVIVAILAISAIIATHESGWLKRQFATTTQEETGVTEKAQLLPNYNDEVPPRNRSIVAGPGMKSGEWPRDGFVRIPPGWGCTYQEEGRVFVRLNKDENKVILDEPLDDARDFGRVVSFEFKSANNEEVIVHLTFFRL